MGTVLLNLLLLLEIICIVSADSQNSECLKPEIRSHCIEQETCDQCLQAHPCCNYCYDLQYDGRKCNVKENLAKCPADKLEQNSKSGIEISQNGDKDFTDMSHNSNADEVIQIKPQHLNINLRKDVPINFTFTYKPARNYPLELYYLADLSASMKEHLKIFKSLGQDLPHNLTQLTGNYKLAFGSFMDKIAMPFYFTASGVFDNPCESVQDKCEPGYLFKHRLNFTENTSLFAEMVGNSNITANVDDLDGALEAIFQILVCGKRVGWSEKSRKLILLPTDSLLHSAGDGILAGAVLKPIDICLLDDDGNHMEPLKYDYPSIGQIIALLKEKKVNIIFAVKDDDKREVYQQLTDEILQDSGYVGKLEENSKNIIDLVSQGYYNFIRQVHFSINTSQSENIDVKFYSDCDRTGTFNETSTCYNVTDQPVHFKVQLTLMDGPAKTNEILYIEERNIHDKVTLNITYLGLCKCQHYDGPTFTCGEHGNFRCGKCACSAEWSGATCEEPCETNENHNICRANETGSFLCSRNGNCICQKCVCDTPYTGTYCEYKCPFNKEICSGKGVCLNGQCSCYEGFDGEDCSCSLSTDNCIFSMGKVCSGKGECSCNECKCINGFSGHYCEINKENNTICEHYNPYVEDATTNGKNFFEIDNETIKLSEVHNDQYTQKCGETNCETVIFQGNTRCTVNYCYISGDDDMIHLLTNKSCFLTAGFKAFTTGISIFLAILLGGLLFIAMYKYRNYKLDQEEYKRFTEATKNISELNPIYKSPVTMYRNPMNTS